MSMYCECCVQVSLPPPPSLRMAGLETDLLSLLGVMPGPEENLEDKLSDLDRTKRAELQKWSNQAQKDSSQLSRLEVQKEELV